MLDLNINRRAYALALLVLDEIDGRNGVRGSAYAWYNGRERGGRKKVVDCCRGLFSVSSASYRIVLY